MARSNAASAWTAIVAFGVGASCSSSQSAPGAAATGGTGTGGTSGAGGSQGTTSSGSSSSSSSAGATASSGGLGGAGGGAFVCDPPAPAGSLYAISADAFGAAGPFSMCEYRGDVALIVNTAAL